MGAVVAELASETFDLQHEALEICAALAFVLELLVLAAETQRGHSFLSCAPTAVARSHAHADDIGIGSDNNVAASTNLPSPLRSH